MQLDCPEDWKTYNHRVGRTARNSTAGSALMVLLPSEKEGIIKQLRANKFQITEEEINPNKLQSIQRKIEAYLASDPELKETAKRAFQHYVKSIYLMKDKSIFDAFALNLDAFAASLGLAVSPTVGFLENARRIKKAKEAKAKMLAAENSEDVPEKGEDEEVVKEEPKKDKKQTVMKMEESGDDSEGSLLKIHLFWGI